MTVRHISRQLGPQQDDRFGSRTEPDFELDDIGELRRHGTQAFKAS